MPETRIDSAVASDLTNAVKDFSVSPETTDAASGSGKTRWQNRKWAQYLGYYKNIPELRAVIDAKATWTVGKGFKASADATFVLNGLVGWGKDTFNTILENLIRTMQIGGDAYGHIIRDDEGNIINLKTLDPEVMVHIVGEDGVIDGYEQTSKIKGKSPKKYKVIEILHLARNRVADEIHGVSLIEALEEIILMRNEAMADNRKAMHWNVIPRWKHKLKTDDPTEIAAYKAKMDAATGSGENIYEPFDVSEGELISVPPNSTLNPIAWIELLNNYFFQAAGVPQIIVGGSAEFSEATAKIAYLAFQQTIEEDQLFIEEQISMQLGYDIELEFPASLENELLSDNKKDGAQNIDPSEMTAGEGQ